MPLRLLYLILPAGAESGVAAGAHSSNEPDTQFDGLDGTAAGDARRRDTAQRVAEQVAARSTTVEYPGERLERELERRGLERNWSRHRPSAALNRPERGLTAAVDLLKSSFPQARALVAATLAVKGSGVRIPSAPQSCVVSAGTVYPAQTA